MRNWVTETYIDKNGEGTTTTYLKCDHSNGFWARIERWWTTERVFACNGCSELIKEKDMPKVAVHWKEVPTGRSKTN